MKNNFDNFKNILNPNTLKSNLILSSLYITFFESLKDYIIDKVKEFYLTGFDSEGFICSPEYDEKIASKITKKSKLLKVSLNWFVDCGAIEVDRVKEFDDLVDYRNFLAHEMSKFMFEGDFDKLVDKLEKLMDLQVDLDRWWILNIEIPTNPDFDNKNIEEENVISSSEILYKIIMEVLSGDEKSAWKYYEEYEKMK